MMEIEQLWELLDRHTIPLAEESVPLAAAYNRVLAKEIFAAIDQPPFDQSAMDGYAVAGSAPFQLVGKQVAGQIPRDSLKKDQAIRVLTGAVVPSGTEAILKQEDCIVDGDWIRPLVQVEPNSHIRLRGAVRKQGDAVLEKSTLITPGCIGLLAASGLGLVPVIRRPRVLHLVTGDELAPVGTALETGQIHDANGPLIAALLRERGISEIQQTHVPDSFEALSGAINSFCGDLLLISGGSGASERDHSIRVLDQAGFTIHVSRINSRPGKPLVFASRGNQLAFGMPGNPLSHFVCYHAFVRRVLDLQEGLAKPELIRAQLKGPITDGGDGRRSWFPAILEQTEAGTCVSALPWQHSGDLTCLAHANALILMDDRKDRRESSTPSNSVSCLPCPQRRLPLVTISQPQL